MGICAVCFLCLGAVRLRAQTVYVGFGDSITAGVGDDPARAEPGYPPRLQDLLQTAGEAATVRNRGVGGEKTPEGLSRIDQVLDEGGDVLLLMEGSNDISRNISVETTLFDLEEMAHRAEQRGWTAVQATVIPRIPQATVDPDNVINGQLNEGIRDMAGHQGRDLVDNFEVFGELPNRFDQYYLKEADDHVGHPNAQGYDVMAQAFFDVLTGVDSVPPVPGLVSPPDGATGVSSASTIAVDVWDFGAGIDLSATRLELNGTAVSATLDGDQRHAMLRYTPRRPLPSVVHVTLRSRDLATPVHTLNREVSRFVIAGAKLIAGDLNVDGRVDGVDLVQLAIHFGAARGSARYDPEADLDGSGVIDGNDLAILGSNFGQSS